MGDVRRTRDELHPCDRQDDVRSLWELMYQLTPHDRQIWVSYHASSSTVENSIGSATRNRASCRYILPVIPGLSVLIVALALGGSGRGVVPAAVLAAAFAAIFTFVLHRAQRTARRLQGEIDELRTYGR